MVVALLLGCEDAGAPRSRDGIDAGTGLDGGGGTDSGVLGDDAGRAIDAEASMDGDAGAAAGGPPSVSLGSRTFVCKLINDTTLDAPTANHTQTRFNLRGTDLGIPLVIGSSLHLFFGDTVGYREIWGFGEDPDSVARIPLADVVADPAALCSGLDFYVTADVPSVAADTDPAIERDFAGAYVTPPPGEPLSRYVAQPPPGFPQIPGTFEVPTGAVMVGGTAYVYYAGAVELTPRTRATLSFLAAWDGPGETVPGYQILFPVDELGSGDLGGHFIQVAPVARGDTLYLFGTGDYRRSGIYLAREPLSSIRARGGHEVFDAASAAWVAPSPSATAILEPEGVGELSVQWIEEAGLFLLVYQRELHDASGALVDNRVVARVARAPEGPWSDAVTVADMADPAFRARHCCGDTCPGEQILHCDRAGLYGAYAIPAVRVGRDAGATELRVPLLVSTWDPYDVALFDVVLSVAP